MDTSTSTGDALDVESTAAILNERALKRENDETPEITEEVTEEVEIEADQAEEVTVEITEESEPGDAETEEAAPSFETIAELAEAAGIPIDEFMKNIKLTTKVNGEESDVTLAELRKGYQLEADYTRKNQEFVDQKKAFDEHQEKERNQVAEVMQKAGTAFQLAQNHLTHEFNAVNWNELQQTDPTQYMLKRQQFGERQAQINQQIKQATREAQAFKDKQAEEAEKLGRENFEKEQDLLLSAIPAWKDSTVRNKEEGEIKAFLQSQGFAENVSFPDHRYILLARAAMNGINQKDINLAKKKVEKVPKLVKANARQNQNLGKTKTLEKLRAKVKKSGNVEDVAALLLQRRG